MRIRLIIIAFHSLEHRLVEIIMADHAADGEIFIYMGGRAPQRVTRVRIDKSVKEIEERAFWNNRRLLEVQMHDGINKGRQIGIQQLPIYESNKFAWCQSC